MHTLRHILSRWFGPLGLGIAIIGIHLVLLNYSGPNYLDKAAYSKHIKYIIFFIWMYGLKSAIQFICRHYPLRPDKQTIRNLWITGTLFILTVVPYGPYDIELTFYFFVSTAGLGYIAYALFRQPALIQAAHFAGQRVSAIIRYPLAAWMMVAFVFSLICSYYLSGAIFNHIPAIDDTIAQYIHAKFVATGHLHIKPPHYSEFFPIRMMIFDHDKWYSQYPPGHVFLLALGFLAGHPEIVCPLLGAATAAAVIWLAKEIYGSYTAKISALLVILCVYLKVVSAEYMNNVTALLTGTLFLWFYFRVLRRGHWLDGLLGGAALGYCFITRPYSAFYLSLPLALYAVYFLATRWRGYLLAFLVFAGATMIFVAFQLEYNAITTGNALIFGYQKAHGAWHNPFTPKAISLLDYQMLWKNLRLNLQRASEFNKILFEWPVPVLALLVPLFLCRGKRREERLLFAVIGSVFLGCLLLPGNIDRGWGPRLAYEITGILIVLCAKSLAMLPALIRRIFKSSYGMRHYYGYMAISLCIFYYIALLYNLNIYQIKSEYLLFQRESNYRYYQSVRHQVEKPALVFVPRRDYKFFAFNNPFNEDSSIIFVADLGGPNAYYIHYMKMRKAWNIYFLRHRKAVLCTQTNACTNYRWCDADQKIWEIFPISEHKR